MSKTGFVMFLQEQEPAAAAPEPARQVTDEGEKPERRFHTTYYPTSREFYDRIRIALIQEGRGRDFNTLVNDLLAAWKDDDDSEADLIIKLRQALRELNDPNQQNEKVNLGVKIPLAWRRHWASESKRRGISMTEVIIAAMIDVFGNPTASAPTTAQAKRLLRIRSEEEE
jgi:hypothetical protein